VEERPLLQYDTLTGPRLVEIAPVKQMGRIRWHVHANDVRLPVAGTFFDTRDLAKAGVEAALKKGYGETVALDWRPG
jgi:hypothetical protein